MIRNSSAKKAKAVSRKK